MEVGKLLTTMVDSYEISPEATVNLTNVNKELIKNLILELKKKIESEIEIDDSSLKGELEKNNLDLNDRYKNILSTLHSVDIKTKSVNSMVSTLITEKVLRPIDDWNNFFKKIVKDDNFSKLIADEISKKLSKKLSNEFSNKSNESKKAVHKEEKAEFICDDFTKIKLKDKYGSEKCVDMEEGADFCEKNGMDFINTPPTLPFCGKRGIKYFGGKKRRKSKRKKRRKTKRRKRNRKKSTRRRKRKSKRKKRRSKRRRKK